MLRRSSDPLGPVERTLTVSRAGIEPRTYMSRVGRACTSPQPRIGTEEHITARTRIQFVVIGAELSVVGKGDAGLR